MLLIKRPLGIATVDAQEQHVQRAANLPNRMNALEKRAWVLDALAYPMMYVSLSGTLHWANQAAEDLLRRGRGLRLRVENFAPSLRMRMLTYRGYWARNRRS